MGANPAGLGTAPACPEHQWVLSPAELGGCQGKGGSLCHRVRAVHSPGNSALRQMRNTEWKNKLKNSACLTAIFNGF